MLGSSLLVAPVFRADGHVQYYLPAGMWTHLQTGQIRQGGSWVREQVGFLSVPAWVRSDALLPMSENEEQTAWKLDDPLVLHAYPFAEASCNSLRLVGDDGATSVVNFRRVGPTLRFDGDGGLRDVRIMLHGVESAEPVENASRLETTGDVRMFRWIDPRRPIMLELDVRGRKRSRRPRLISVSRR
jgi:alpha-D-xyloside xylohydrolase